MTSGVSGDGGHPHSPIVGSPRLRAAGRRAGRCAAAGSLACLRRALRPAGPLPHRPTRVEVGTAPDGGDERWARGGLMAGNPKARVEAVRVPPDRIRNVVLVGHAAGGKTALVEALLLGTGAIAAPGPGRGRVHGLRPRGRRAPAGPLGLAGRGVGAPRGGEGNLRRHPGSPRLRRRGAGGAEGGGCRPLRRLGRGRRRRHDPDALGGVRRRRHAASRRGHPPRPAARRTSTRRSPICQRVFGDGRPAAVPAAAQRRGGAGRA